MSIESLCQGDIVVVQNRTETVGASFGRSVSWTNGNAYDCNIQIDDRGDPDGAKEARDYSARGQRTSYKVYFATNPRLAPKHLLKWTAEANETLETPKYLRVLDFYKEGRPGEDLLWIADAELLDTRPEA